MTTKLTIILIGSGLLAPAAFAQYSIDWYTIDGGGGTSTGGVYSVSGTIGQPDAGGPMTGGAFAITGGFWSLVAAIQTSGAPYLSVTNAGGAVVVSWPRPADGWVLDQTPTLTGSPLPWSQVAFPYQTNAAQIFLTVPAPAGNTFYRLRKP